MYFVIGTKNNIKYICSLPGSLFSCVFHAWKMRKHLKENYGKNWIIERCGK